LLFVCKHKQKYVVSTTIKAKVLVYIASKQVLMTTTESKSAQREGHRAGELTKPDGQIRHMKCNLYTTLQHMTKQIGVKTWWRVD